MGELGLTELDSRLLASALSLARAAEGSCYPNPAVGCVIALGAEIIGFAATGAGGVPHAEPRAIGMARSRLAGRGRDLHHDLHHDLSLASLYVVLEPCAHSGKTAPCVDAIISSGIKRVVYGLRDPDTRTNGKGCERLRAAGIEVIEADSNSELGLEIAEFFSSHCKRVRYGLPFCTLKLAISLDGKISASNPKDFGNRDFGNRDFGNRDFGNSGNNFSPRPSNERTLISSPAARPLRDAMLRRTDAVMVGARTMRSDNPRLLLDGDDGLSTDDESTSRDFAPIRVLVDGRLTIALESKLVQTIARAPLWIITRQGEILSDKGKALRNSGVRFIAAAASLRQGGGVSLSLRSAMESLGEAGVASLLCEGGARLAHSLFREGLVDRLVLFCANRVLGSQGLSMLEGELGEAAQDFIVESELRLGDGLGDGLEDERASDYSDRIITLRPRKRELDTATGGCGC